MSTGFVPVDKWQIGNGSSLPLPERSPTVALSPVRPHVGADGPAFRAHHLRSERAITRKRGLRRGGSTPVKMGSWRSWPTRRNPPPPSTRIQPRSMGQSLVHPLALATSSTVPGPKRGRHGAPAFLTRVCPRATMLATGGGRARRIRRIYLR